jgi:aspartyl/asparaginyl beta-hydroxylase (cupin superfamily)
MRFGTKEQYPFLAVFEQNWQLILKEFLSVKDMMVAWPEYQVYNDNWEVFGLFEWPSGDMLPGAKLCPVTVELVKKSIGVFGAVAFSRLGAGTIISPHKGFPGEVLRMHLALEVPQGDCAFRSVDELRKWTPGEAFVFDDRLEHEAWNKTSEDRIVLIVDFLP